MCVVLRVHTLKLNIGDWSNGMIGVSKTFGGSSILSSPVLKNLIRAHKIAVFEIFIFMKNTSGYQLGYQNIHSHIRL